MSDIKWFKVTELFKKWYEHYPNKKNKGRAVKVFEKLNPSEELVEQMIDAINIQTQERDIRNQLAMWSPDWPLPATWLNDRRWEDEVNLNPEPQNEKQRRVKEDYEFRQRQKTIEHETSLEELIELVEEIIEKKLWGAS